MVSDLPINLFFKANGPVLTQSQDRLDQKYIQLYNTMSCLKR